VLVVTQSRRAPVAAIVSQIAGLFDPAEVYPLGAPCPHTRPLYGRSTAAPQVRKIDPSPIFSVTIVRNHEQQTMPLHNLSFAAPTLTGLLTTLVPVLVQFALFLRWLHRRMREDEIVHACVRDIALNHLPHIYNSLQAIGAKQGITLHEFPVIHFVDLGRNHGRSA
jgi:hypothetical protein